MAKATRAKTRAANIAVPQNREDAAAAVRRVGEIRRNVTRLETQMNDEIAAIKSRFELAANPLRDELESEVEGLRVWSDANRTALTGGDKTKTVDLGTGVVKWRLRPPSVTLVRGLKMDDVLRKIRELGGKTFIRTKEELDKDRILAAAARQPKTPTDQTRHAFLLATFTAAGIRIGTAGEDFVVEPAELQLAEAAGGQ